MQTISTVKSPEYYEEQEMKQEKSVAGRKDIENYLNEAGKVIGRFSGAGCDDIGITGSIKNGEFLDLMKGVHPHSKKQLWKDAKCKPKFDKDGKKLPPPYKGTDGTLSAVKHVSILYALADDDMKAKILEKFNEAVDSTIELNCSKLYRRLNSKNEKSKDVRPFVATFVHTTARPVGGNRPDPQLHAHNVYLRKCSTIDGLIKTVENHPLFLNQKLGGAHFRAKLAKGMRELEFGVVPFKEEVFEEGKKHKISSFGIVGISDEMVKHFSNRNNQIVEVSELSGKKSTIDKFNISQNIKRSKQNWNEDDLTAVWKKEAKELFNFDSETVKSIRCNPDDYLLKGAKLESYIIKSALTHGKLYESKLMLRLTEYEQYTGIDAKKYFDHMVETKVIERVEGFLFKCNIKLDNAEVLQKEFSLKKKAIHLNSWKISNSYETLLLAA